MYGNYMYNTRSCKVKMEQNKRFWQNKSQIFMIKVINSRIVLKPIAIYLKHVPGIYGFKTSMDENGILYPRAYDWKIHNFHSYIHQYACLPNKISIGRYSFLPDAIWRMVKVFERNSRDIFVRITKDGRVGRKGRMCFGRKVMSWEGERGGFVPEQIISTRIYFVTTDVLHNVYMFGDVCFYGCSQLFRILICVSIIMFIVKLHFSFSGMVLAKRIWNNSY